MTATSTSIAITKRDANICLTMLPSTAAALAIGLGQASEQPNTSRRARLFYATIAALIDDGLHTDADEVHLPMSGEPVVLEGDEPRHELPAVPTLFAGKWQFKSYRQVEGLTLREKRLTAVTVYAFVEKARHDSLPLPAGLIDWLIAAPLESEARFITTDYDITINVTGR